MLTVSKASQPTASTLTTVPRAPQDALRAARTSAATGDQQEGDVDGGGAEGDQAADRGRIEAEQQAGPGDHGGGDDRRRRGLAAVDLRRNLEPGSTPSRATE